MKKLSLAFVAVVALSVFGLTGCGGPGETSVITEVAPGEPEMTPEEQAKFDREMEESMKEQGGN